MSVATLTPLAAARAESEQLMRELDRAERERNQERKRREREALEQFKAAIRARAPELERRLYEAANDPQRTPEDILEGERLLTRYARGWRRLRKDRLAAEREQQRREIMAPVEVAGSFVVRVPLRGRYGRGRFATVDAEAWPGLESMVGTQWRLSRTITAAEHVVSSSPAAVRAALAAGVITGKSPVVPIARFIAGAAPWQPLLHRDGDRLNLRRDNLHLLPFAEGR